MVLTPMRVEIRSKWRLGLSGEARGSSNRLPAALPSLRWPVGSLTTRMMMGEAHLRSRRSSGREDSLEGRSRVFQESIQSAANWLA